MPAKLAYTCSDCGASQSKWAGQCPDCDSWNSLVEVTSKIEGKAQRFTGFAGAVDASVVKRLGDIPVDSDARHSTGLGEFDRVLGGGLVHGSVVLIGGDPGIGKSTILLQALVNLNTEVPVLYVTGEESLQQVRVRAQRLGLEADDLCLLAETKVDTILSIAERTKPKVLVIDSIQTVYSSVLQSAPGSVAQVRESAAQLVRYAKQTGTALFLVGHVTKEGTLAGPRVLEHMVDTVLYFEGDSGTQFRIIRSAKNRFGAANELGVFAMGDTGLKEVTNPSAIFLSRHETDAPGSVVMVTREGTRPMLVEVQALVDEGNAGNPRRVSLGLEQNRLSMLLAVFHRHGGIAMYDQDVFVNVVGGVRITETGADLAVLLAVLSSFRDKPLPRDLIVFGELGLAGELRPVPGGQERLREAAKHGFKTAIIPAGNAPKKKIKGLEVHAVPRLQDALNLI